MLGLKTSQDSDNIKLNEIEFTLVARETRAQLHHPDKLSNQKYQIDYHVMFPETMPDGWCVCLQLLQVSSNNNVKNPTLQMNVSNGTVKWFHKTVEQGAGESFCSAPFIPGVMDKWRIIISVTKRAYDHTHLIIERNGKEIGRITGQTIVDVDQQPSLQYGLYSTDWDDVDKQYRRCVVSHLEMKKL